MATKSKWFCIAVEGATASDDRTITAQMLTEMAGGYSRPTYGARINMEHIRGFSAEGPFKAYGDVLELKTDTVELEIDSKKERRLGLFALIEPTDDLVKITNAGQKIYTSMEVEPNFAKTGKFGLTGLAVTDTPASLGTDILKFSASADPNAATVKAMLDGRKSSATSFFSAAYETKIEWEAEAVASTDFLKAFSAIGDKIAAALAPKPAEAPKPANDNTQLDANAFAAALKEGLTAVGQQVADANKTAADQYAALKRDFDTLKTGLESTEKNYTKPPVAAGGEGRVLADY